jgi:hypothetical protein
VWFWVQDRDDNGGHHVAHQFGFRARVDGYMRSHAFVYTEKPTVKWVLCLTSRAGTQTRLRISKMDQVAGSALPQVSRHRVGCDAIPFCSPGGLISQY